MDDLVDIDALLAEDAAETLRRGHTADADNGITGTYDSLPEVLVDPELLFPATDDDE